VDASNRGKFDQHFQYNDATSRGDSNIMIHGAMGVEDENLAKVSLAPMIELSKFNLITFEEELLPTASGHISRRWRGILLQELWNAIESDFEVSDYFLTMNAVGTIVQGNLTIQPGAVFQSAASIQGDIQITALADEIAQQLGQEFLADQRNRDVAESIDNLRNATDATRAEKLGKVIQELGRSLGHTANFAVIAQALLLIAPHISSL
jgi:hypothetical protein